MKQILLLLTLLIVFSLGNAQTFTVSPSNSISIAATNGMESHGYIYFKNDRSADITLVWELETTNMQDTNWHVQICDNNICYNGLQQGATMAPINPAKQAFLKLIVTPTFTQTMSGSIAYKVWIENEPATAVIVTYTVNTTVGIGAKSLETSITVYPNPVSSELNLRAVNGSLERGTVQVYDMAGHLLRSQQVKGVETVSLNVADLPNATYLMRYITKAGIVTKRFEHIN